MTKSRLKVEHANFERYVANRMAQTRLPKYVKDTVAESIAQAHTCGKVKGYWVQLYPKKRKERIVLLPHKRVLEELEMTEEEFLKLKP